MSVLALVPTETSFTALGKAFKAREGEMDRRKKLGFYALREGFCQRLPGQPILIGLGLGSRKERPETGDGRTEALQVKGINEFEKT